MPRAKLPPDAQDMLPVIVQACQARPEIIAAWLFGSFACGTSKPNSDIDIAILLQGEDPYPMFAPELASDLERSLRRPVDVVVLNRAGELLKFEVRCKGHLIVDRHPSARKHFEIMSRKYYEDFLYLHRRYTQKVLYGK